MGILVRWGSFPSFTITITIYSSSPHLHCLCMHADSRQFTVLVLVIHSVVRLKLIEGIMSAISAGMLIYAACVEMLAGDFVLDPTLWRSGVKRQVLALASLLGGIAGMGLIG